MAAAALALLVEEALACPVIEDQAPNRMLQNKAQYSDEHFAVPKKPEGKSWLRLQLPKHNSAGRSSVCGTRYRGGLVLV